VRWYDDQIEIRAEALSVKLVRESRLLVAVPQTEIEQLTSGIVEATRQTLADERAFQE
jgi:hypothetical protein